MSLTAALNIAQSALGAASRQTGVVSRNIANASNPDYARRTAVSVSTVPGVRATEIQRAADALLTRQNLAALSAWNGSQALSVGLESLAQGVNGVSNESSAATMLGKLSQALQTYGAAPSNRTLAENAVEAARNVVRSLNEGSAAIQTARADADAGIASAVSDLQSLLASFGAANAQVTAGSAAGRDISDALDARDATLKKIAELVPVSTITRGNNDMVLFTGDGATLFETIPRTISFAPTPSFGANVAGGAVLIDGVPLKGSASGRIAGLVQLRDTATTQLQSQLDEVARGLIGAFRETDQSGAGLPDRAGLFTWPGAPALPPAGTLSGGLAASIGVNSAFDSGAGGDPVRLRDGGANGVAYAANASGAASYSSLILAYSDRLNGSFAFDPAAGLGGQATLNGFAAASVGFLDGSRQSALRAAESNEALSARVSEALSNATGVNVDTEMSLLLDLEHAYEASARLIKAVDEMLSTLLAAVG